MIKYVELSGYLKEASNLYNYYISNTCITFFTKELTSEKFYFEVLPKGNRYLSYAIIDEDEFAGFMYYSPYSKKQGYDKTAEVTIYLKQEKKGKNIGKEAIIFLEKSALKEGIEKFIALITSTNKESLTFFNSLGYENVGYLKNVGFKFGKYHSVDIFMKTII